MATIAERTKNAGLDLEDVEGLRPLANVDAITGVRVYDVGQGDGIAILGPNHEPVLQFDYGGRQGNQFTDAGVRSVDNRMPVASHRLLMISHWDEDHWCSARKGQSAKSAAWLVPRQITSPRAVRFSADISRIHCIPPTHVSEGYRFRAKNGDSIWWEKIAAAPDGSVREEDCNRTGVALSVVKAGDRGAVILLPGDAPFDRVGHYRDHFSKGLPLRGLVAFHHGAGTHWTNATRRLLQDWSARSTPPQVVFSCADPNAYRHPQTDEYTDNVSGCCEATYRITAAGRKLPEQELFTDILF